MSIETVAGYSWSSYHRKVREILRSEYGLTRISKDKYREQFFVGNNPNKAAEQISLRSGNLSDPFDGILE